jgi:hypothetical protein
MPLAFLARQQRRCITGASRAQRLAAFRGIADRRETRWLSEIRRPDDSWGKESDLQGSAELIESLMGRGQIDEFMLMIPAGSGIGRRLFTDGSPSTTLELLDSKTSTTGVVIASYQPIQHVSTA